MNTYHVSPFFDIDITYPNANDVLIEGKSPDFIRYEIERTIEAGHLAKELCSFFLHFGCEAYNSKINYWLEVLSNILWRIEIYNGMCKLDFQQVFLEEAFFIKVNGQIFDTHSYLHGQHLDKLVLSKIVEAEELALDVRAYIMNCMHKAGFDTNEGEMKL